MPTSIRLSCSASTRPAAALSAPRALQTNGGGPLLIEHSVRVPEEMRNDTRAEVTRLSAVAGADPLAKLAMMKASYLFCLATQVRWMVICARSEAFVRQYSRLGFTNLYDDGRLVPMLHVGRMPHHVLTFNVTGAESRWRHERHALYDFMIDTAHPDIQLFSQKPALPRRDPARRAEQQQTLGSFGTQARNGRVDCQAARLVRHRSSQLNRVSAIRPALLRARFRAVPATAGSRAEAGRS